MKAEEVQTQIIKWWREPSKLDWTIFESLLVAILRSNDSDSNKIEICKEALDAFTRRGYFQ